MVFGCCTSRRARDERDCTDGFAGRHLPGRHRAPVYAAPLLQLRGAVGGDGAGETWGRHTRTRERLRLLYKYNIGAFLFVFWIVAFCGI